MRGLNIVALFCEDIREEKGDTFTIVGVMPDNVNVESANIPATVPSGSDAPRLFGAKLCVYLRINFVPDMKFGTPRVILVPPVGEAQQVGILDEGIVEKARREAIRNGAPLAGVIAKMVFGGIQLPTSGTLAMHVEIDGDTYIAGAIVFREAPGASSDVPPQT